MSHRISSVVKTMLLSPIVMLAGCATTAVAPRTAPAVDYHQHLVSPAFAPVVGMPERDGAALVRELDEAGIDRAVVLSVGYSFADERKGLSDPDRLTSEENDWTSAQVTANARRLIGFCSANPLRDAALQELERCLGLPGMAGIKVHMGNSGVTLRDPAHLARMQQLFALAERRGVPVLVHMRARGGANFGPEDVWLLLAQVVPRAPNTEIVIAHLGFAGPGYPPENDAIMAAFGQAALRSDPNMRNIYFDVATNVTVETTSEEAALVARRLREVGIERVLYGSDLSPPGGSIRAGWEIFRGKIPFTQAEFDELAGNRTRFAR